MITRSRNEVIHCCRLSLSLSLLKQESPARNKNYSTHCARSCCYTTASRTKPHSVSLMNTTHTWPTVVYHSARKNNHRVLTNNNINRCLYLRTEWYSVDLRNVRHTLRPAFDARYIIYLALSERFSLRTLTAKAYQYCRSTPPTETSEEAVQ